MKFTAKYTARWHDTDANRVVRAGKLVEYMQETANRQCEHSGIPLDALRDEKGLGFILGSISLKIDSPLHAYEDFEVRTWCKRARGYIFNRYFEIARDGSVIASASTVWVLIDVKEKKMVRAEAVEWMHDSFFYDDPISPDALPPKARIPRDVELYEIGKRTILYSDIDYNMHMNNTRYPDMICDFIPEMTADLPLRVHNMSLTYIKESPLGETLTLLRGETDENVILIRTQNCLGETCLEATVSLCQI